MTYGDVIGTVGLVVSVVGFWLAIDQLRKTTSAARATGLAIDDANKQMLLNHMLVLMPQLKSVDSDLDAAIMADDSPAAVRALVEFSYSAKQIASLLSVQAPAEEEALIASLKKAAETAVAGKAALLYGATQPLKKVLRPIAEEIGRVASDCAALSLTYQTKAV
jgi:hypothetical protein